ncbi:MAG: S49 family peptidase [Gammaproteobacteria bacterium]
MTEDGDRKLVERLAESSLREQRARRRWGAFFRLLFFAYLFAVTGAYVFGVPGKFEMGYDKPHAAVVDISGVIAAGGKNDALRIGGALREAFNNDAAKGVILRINSPGGSPVESNRIYRELRRLRELHPDKKVYAVAGDYCASGGYYIAAGADEIYVDENSVIGSIGAVIAGFGFTGAMEKFGVERRAIASADGKTFLDPFSPADPRDERRAREILQSVHDNFAAAVREGRGGRLSGLPDIFSGALFSGGRGVELGLADGVGDSNYVAREVIGVQELVQYNGERDFIDELANRLGVAIAAALQFPSLQ